MAGGATLDAKNMLTCLNDEKRQRAIEEETRAQEEAAGKVSGTS